VIEAPPRVKTGTCSPPARETKHGDSSAHAAADADAEGFTAERACRCCPTAIESDVPRNRRIDERSPPAIRVLFIAGLCAFAFLLQFATPNLGSIDGYFHIRYSALIAAAGWRHFPPPFPWLPETILAPQDYFDHHLLFHLWLVPFTRGDLVLGAKLAAAIGAALVFVVSYLFLSWRRVRRAEWWTVALLAGAPGFLYRMEMPRVQAWSVVFLLLALGLIMARRWAWLLPLAWVYTWLYDAFPFLVLLCACATVAHWLLERRLVWQPLAFATAGIAGALVVNPYFPNDLRFLFHHYLGKLRMPAAVRVGAEWYPEPLLAWFGWGGLLAILAGVAALLVHGRKRLDAGRLTAILAATVFLVLLWRSSRFVEYFVPFAAVSLALSLHESVDALVRRGPRLRYALAAGLAAWLLVSSAIAAVRLRGRPPAGRFKAAAAWISGHTPRGALVFNVPWDTFPQLFFHDPANAYVIGLDPTYLAQRDFALYEAWAGIGAGRVVAPARQIAERFGASVALATPDAAGFLASMDRDPDAERVYEDDDAVVYRVRAPASASGAES
jgi:hypothetical protein